MNRLVAFLFVLGLTLTASGGPFGVAVASHRVAGHRTMQGACPDRGTWPGPNGSHFLNEFNDGNCGVLIQPSTFPDSRAGTPAVLDMDSGTWTVEGDVFFDTGSDVTVEPGVAIVDSFANGGGFGGFINVNGTMTFNAGSSLQGACTKCGIIVSEYSFHHGTLNVQGTAAAPVTMTGPVPASWMGLVIHSNSAVQIDHLNLSGAGANTQPCGGCDAYTDGIFIQNNSPVITNSTISNNFGNGIEVNNWNSAPTFTNLTLSGNTAYPIQYNFLTSTLTNITGLSLSGNGHDAVRMVNDTAMQYGSSLKVTWPNLGYPIVDDVDTGITDSASLTVEPGTTVKFGPHDGLGVHGGSRLTMKGTPAQPITLTSDADTPAPGAWTGLTIPAYSTAVLDHVHLSYAGQSIGCPCGDAAVYVDTASPLITNSTIDFSGANGVVVTRGGQPVLRGDALANNNGYPLIYRSVPLNLGAFPDLYMSGNARNMLWIDSSGWITGSVSWPNFGVPYLLSDSASGTGAFLQVRGTGSKLTVAPGLTIRFVPGEHEMLEVGSGASLVMDGTASQPIRLTSAAGSPAPGDWGTLQFDNASKGHLSYLSMAYGGNCGYCGTDTILDYGANFSMTNTSISHSNGNDVEVRSGGLPVMHADSFGAVPKGNYGVLNAGWAAGQPLVDATTSCWVDTSGPYHPKSNPKGKGTPVSDGVNYVPWADPAKGACGVPPLSLKAKFDWSMPNRFGQVGSDGMITMVDPNDPRIASKGCDLSIPTCAYVHPTGFTVDFNACTSTDPGQITSYTWSINGPGLDTSISTGACHLLNPPTFPQQAPYTVSLTITDEDGHTATVKQTVKIRDYLIVSVGDSYGSGEGNPDIPQVIQNLVVKRGAVWEDSVTDKSGYPDGHVHSQCHRSEFAGPAQAALALERSNPHSSVTFLSLACSGAGIVDGLLGPYAGVEPRVDGRTLPPQIDQLAKILCVDPSLGCPGPGARHVDALLMSIGGNDANFADIIYKCIIDNSPPNPFANPLFGGVEHPCYNDDRVTQRLQGDLLRLPDLYGELGNAITQKLDATKTYITEYPDPSRLDDGSWCGHSVEPTSPDDLITTFITTSEWQWASGSVVGPLDATVANSAAANGWDYVGGISAGFLGGPHAASHGYCAKDHWLVRMLESILNQGPETGQGVPTIESYKETKGTMHPNSIVDRKTHTVVGGGQWMYATQILRSLGTIDTVRGAAIHMEKTSSALVVNGTTYIYTLGQSGHIYQIAHLSSGWQFTDLSALLGYQRFIATPIVRLEGNVVHVYDVTSTFHLYDISRASANAPWSVSDISATTGIGRIGGVPAPVLSGGTLHFFVLGQNGHLLDLAQVSGSWTLSDLSSAAGISQALGGTPSALVQGTSLHIYVVGQNYHLFAFSNATGAWQGADLSQAVGGTQVGGVPTAYDDGTTIHVFTLGKSTGRPGTGINGHVLQWDDGASPKVTDVTAVMNWTAVRTISQPLVVGSTLHLFATDFADHLIDLARTGSTWKRTDVSALTGGTKVFGIPAPVLSGSSLQVYITGMDMHATEFSLDSGTWHAITIT